MKVPVTGAVSLHWFNLSFILVFNKSMADEGATGDVPSMKKKKIEVAKFPTTLDGFGYTFVNNQLKNSSTGEGFQFEVKKDDPDYNQKRYEALGEVITNYVYDLLITEGKLTKCFIPINSTSSNHETFIFHSEDVFTNEKLIVLIHGSGVVRAGQWSRKLIINDNLESGTQLPFIKKAAELGFSVVVLNTNDNSQNGGPVKHAVYVWKELISKTSAKHIAIIAHSYGGFVTVELCKRFPAECKEKIFAIAFTDSVHRLAYQQTPTDTVHWLQKVAQNWVVSDRPLNEPVQRKEDKIPCVSAGTTVHEMTSWSCFEPLFRFLERRYDERANRVEL